MEYSKETIDAIAKLNNTSDDVVKKQLSLGADLFDKWSADEEKDFESLIRLMKVSMRQIADEEKKSKKPKKVKKGKKGRGNKK